MQRIVLPKGEWFFDPSKPLGKPGGFGAVFEGLSDTHGALAVKRLHLTSNDAAHREMRIAAELAGREFKNVMPVFDSGEDAESGMYFVVMPMANGNLQQDIGSGVASELGAATVMSQVTNGLLEVNDIVHRDLKPANILFHSGCWKVADFGIARFLEESTSLETLKGCLSPPYAAPEQWQYIRAGHATDIYALGCIGYALLTGSPPFEAEDQEGFRERHLNAQPPALPGQTNPRLRSLLTMMLRKPPEARPSLERVSAILEELVEALKDPSEGKHYAALAEAGERVARLEADAQRRQQEHFLETQARGALAETGREILGGIVERLRNRILSEAPNARKQGLITVLGLGELEASLSRAHGYTKQPPFPPGAFEESKWDVVAVEEICVRQGMPEYIWGCSLWYCRLPDTPNYRWYEVGYYAPFHGERMAPYSLARQMRDADLAAGPIMHVYGIAVGPSPIDDEDEDEFIERWAALLALAAEGKLGHPSNLPLRSHFWRKPFVA